MEKRKLLIADGSEDFLLAIAGALGSRCHLLCCRDGNQALELLRREKCDMIVLDLMLPGLDGITLLEIAQSEGLRPAVLALTPLLNDYVVRSVNRLGVSFVLRKPCALQSVVARVEDLWEPVRKPDERQLASEILLSLGLSAKHDGCDYLLECIPSFAKDPHQAFTKELYPAVGKRFGRSGSQVERSIRSALDAAWEHRDDAVWQKYFPPSSKRPTGSDFIIRMAEVLRKSWE